MGRDELKSKAEPGGFIEYGKEQLPKIDSMRRDKTQPDFYGVPILHDEQVMFTRASEMGNKPASCTTCHYQQSDKTCHLIGPSITVSKVTGHKESGDPIEYWPCCDMHSYGEPSKEKPHYDEVLSNPNTLGLVWINAGEPGQPYGGANCGGVEGGDDCDHYMVSKGDKWENPQGLCRVLAHTVDAGDVCTAWWDDDILEWEEAQQLIRGSRNSVEYFKNRRLAKSVMGRDDGESTKDAPLRRAKARATMGVRESASNENSR